MRGKFMNQNVNISGLKINAKMNGIQKSDLTLQFTLVIKILQLRRVRLKILTYKINHVVSYPF